MFLTRYSILRIFQEEPSLLFFGQRAEATAKHDPSWDGIKSLKRPLGDSTRAFSSYHHRLGLYGSFSFIQHHHYQQQQQQREARRIPWATKGRSFKGTFLEEQRREMATEANEVRPGMLISYESSIWEVLDSSSRKSARGRANTSLELRELGPNPRKKSLTLRTVDPVEVVEMETKRALFVASEELSAEEQQKIKAGKSVPRLITLREEDDEDEEFSVDTTELGLDHLIPYLAPDMPLIVSFIDDEPVQLRFPRNVSCRVVEAAERDSKKGGTKPVRLENGRTILAPRHVNQGDTIIVDLPDETYNSKV